MSADFEMTAAEAEAKTKLTVRDMGEGSRSSKAAGRFQLGTWTHVKLTQPKTKQQGAITLLSYTKDSPHPDGLPFFHFKSGGNTIAEAVKNLTA